MNKLVIVTTHCVDTSKNVFTIGGVQTYMRDLYNLAIENNNDAIIVEMPIFAPEIYFFKRLKQLKL